VLVVQNFRVVPLRVKRFDILKLPVYACFFPNSPAKIPSLVLKALRSVPGKKIKEIETMVYYGYARRSKGYGATRVTIVTRVFLAVLKKAERYVLAVTWSVCTILVC
jgi:hypothetical protein